MIMMFRFVLTTAKKMNALTNWASVTVGTSGYLTRWDHVQLLCLWARFQLIAGKKTT